MGVPTSGVGAKALLALAEPFTPTDLEWRIMRAGRKDTGEIWAVGVPYVTSRAIMDRLDQAVGPGNWQNEFKEWGLGTPGVLCGISINVEGSWVTKWDGAEQPPERGGMAVAVKGGFSAALKRAAVTWGIGRYLYSMPEKLVKLSEKGHYYQPASKDRQSGAIKVPAFRWDPPALPAWAVPSVKEGV